MSLTVSASPTHQLDSAQVADQRSDGTLNDLTNPFDTRRMMQEAQEEMARAQMQAHQTGRNFDPLAVEDELSANLVSRGVTNIAEVRHDLWVHTPLDANILTPDFGATEITLDGAPNQHAEQPIAEVQTPAKDQVAELRRTLGQAA